MNKKCKLYEEISISIVLFPENDVIATSTGIEVPWYGLEWGEEWE